MLACVISAGVAKGQVMDSVEDCARMYNYGSSLDQFQQWQKAYDTIKTFIERCPNTYQAWRGFGITSDAINNIFASTHDTLLWTNYRAWLESVLYLNTVDPEYFCQCARTIGTTLSAPDSALRSKNVNIPLAVIRWLALNAGCDTPGVWQEYDAARKSQYRQWRADSALGYHYNLDTTLPSLHDLGLDTLFARHFLYASVEKRPQTLFNGASASPNPTTESCVINFGLSNEAYVKLELYNTLGEKVEIPPLENLFQVGNHAIPLSLHSLASGTYYARLVTAYGEAQTVKIVKQ